MPSEPYITISMSKGGKILQVRQGDRVIGKKKGKTGPARRGGNTRLRGNHRNPDP